MDERPLPPTVDGYPLVGNAPELLRDAAGFYERAPDRGDVVRVTLPGFDDQVLVCHPAHVERVLTGEGFRKARFVRGTLEDLLGRGLIHSEGDLWRRQRALIQPLFSADTVETYRATIRTTVERFVDGLEDGAVLDLERAFRRLSLEILLRTVFGEERAGVVEPLLAALDDVRQAGRSTAQPVVHFLPSWLPHPVWRRYRRGVESIDRYVRECISRRRSGSGAAGDDVLSRLLAATDADGRPLDEELVRDELVSLLFAGHDTTAVTVSVAVHQLCWNDPVMARVRTATREAGPDDAGPSSGRRDPAPTVDDVVRESVRLVPPIPNVYREPSADVDFDGYRVPRGTPVAASAWAIHRDDRWYDDPRAFRPRRWRDGDRDRPRFAYLPFGGGPRRCVGKGFAELEARIVLATLLRAADVELLEDRPLRPSVTITTQLSGEHRIRIRTR